MAIPKHCQTLRDMPSLNDKNIEDIFAGLRKKDKVTFADIRTACHR